MSKYTRIFDDAKDVHVSGTVFYAKADNGELFVDAEFETAVSKEILKDLFFKGCWVLFNGVYYAPASLAIGGESEAALIVACAGETHYTFKSAVPEITND